MISTVEALGFRCLKYVRQDLDTFHILIGPNASGKSTFLDVIRFLGDLVSGGLDAALRERTDNLEDLVWRHQGGRFELAIEASIPESQRRHLADQAYARCRYEVTVAIDSGSGENVIAAERLLLLPEGHRAQSKRSLFPESVVHPNTLQTRQPDGTRTVVHKVAGGNDRFCSETGKKWEHTFRLGPRKSALANLPEDEQKFPVSTWFKRALIDGVQSLALNSSLMRRPSPPGQARGLRPDGSNLPWVVDELAKHAPERLEEWVGHLRSALPELDGVCTVEREEDRHRYLAITYADGLKVPAWMVSDGTLRLMALTILAYVPDLRGVYLIEEPENGIHPRAVETVFQSLSSIYDAQVLLATHSPVILSLAHPEQVLCFAKAPDGATDVVDGSRHPALRNWKGETNLGVLYAAGILQ